MPQMSSLSGKQLQPYQNTQRTSSQLQVCNRHVKTQPVDDRKKGRHKEELGEQDKWNKADKDQKAGDSYSSDRPQKWQTGIHKVCRSTAGNTLKPESKPQSPNCECRCAVNSSARKYQLGHTKHDRLFQSLNTGTEQLYELKDSFKHYQLSRLERTSCLQSGAF